MPAHLTFPLASTTWTLFPVHLTRHLDLNNVFAITKFGHQIYSKAKFKRDIFLLFGSETKGLPNDIIELLSERSLRVPMVDQSRSINLSNTVALVAYEAWRQLKFSGAKL